VQVGSHDTVQKYELILLKIFQNFENIPWSYEIRCDAVMENLILGDF